MGGLEQAAVGRTVRCVAVYGTQLDSDHLEAPTRLTSHRALAALGEQFAVVLVGTADGNHALVARRSTVAAGSDGNEHRGEGQQPAIGVGSPLAQLAADGRGELGSQR